MVDDGFVSQTLFRKSLRSLRRGSSDHDVITPRVASTLVLMSLNSDMIIGRFTRTTCKN